MSDPSQRESAMISSDVAKMAEWNKLSDEEKALIARHSRQ